MKNTEPIILMVLMLMICTGACRNNEKPASPAMAEEGTPIGKDLVLVGKDIITEVIVKPDTLGDPWEVEKVQGYNGSQMYTSLFSDIYSGKLQVYDVIEEKILKPGEVREIEKQFNADLTRIAKLQFLEDWYYDPAKNEIIKKIRSLSFGYEVLRDGGLPPGYFPLFRLKME